jgi:hypothetical protein
MRDLTEMAVAAPRVEVADGRVSGTVTLVLPRGASVAGR